MLEKKAYTSKNGFVRMEFLATNTEHDVAERATVEQRTEVVTQSTFGNFDRRTAGLAGHVHRLSNDTYLPAKQCCFQAYRTIDQLSNLHIYENHKYRC